MDNKETPRMTALKKYNVARGNLLLMVGLTAINVILAAVVEILTSFIWVIVKNFSSKDREETIRKICITLVAVFYFC